MPLAKLENGGWHHPSRLPLGCGWSGHCTAPGHEGELPPQDILESLCNLGYAGNCGWSPAQRTWDAVRFAVSTPNGSSRGKRLSSALDSPSRVLRLIYVCERDHHPVAHGELTFDLTTATWQRGHDDTRIQKMAECFLESYLGKNT
jgi:hypothetical protein